MALKSGGFEGKDKMQQRIMKRNVPVGALVTVIVASLFCRDPSFILAWGPTENGRSRPQPLRLILAMSSSTRDDGERNQVITSATSANDDLYSLQAQAIRLRQEALELQRSLEESKLEKIRKETEKIDKWIEELLIEAKLDENTELLKTVDGVLERLRDDRYSAEQVNKIFKRLCEIRRQESLSDCSPLMSLLVDAAGKLDCLEREENPNKRWNGRVERALRKKLFARDWNIELEDEDDNDASNPWKIR